MVYVHVDVRGRCVCVLKFEGNVCASSCVRAQCVRVDVCAIATYVRDSVRGHSVCVLMHV